MNTNLDINEKILTLRVPGDLISTNVEALHSEINGLLGPANISSQSWNIFRLDLSSTTMVDSVGLNLIVTVLKRVQTREAKMQIAYSSQHVLRALTFTRIDKYVELMKI